MHTQPTFDPEVEAELKKRRAERDEKTKQRQDDLKQKFLAQKAIEEKARQEEIKVSMSHSLHGSGSNHLLSENSRRGGEAR